MRGDVQREYGGALWMLAADEGCTDEIRGNLRTIRALLRDEPEYLRLICAPNILLEERLGLLDEAFRGSVHPYVLNFLKLLTERRHFALLPDCIDEFCRRYDEENNIENVTVVSAVPLTAEQKQRLGRTLSEKRKKNIRLTAEVDPTLIGGLRIQTENAALDSTVRGRIETIREQLHTATI